MINTAAYSFASTAYPEDVDKVVSLMEGFVGIGITVSPIIGVFIYQALGFSMTFYIFGAAMAPISIMVFFTLTNPKQIKENR